MNAPTDKQLEVLRGLSEGMAFKAICARMGITSTRGIWQHATLLARKGLVAKRGTGNQAVYVPTAGGWALLGKRTCEKCSGTGLINATTTKGQ